MRERQPNPRPDGPTIPGRSRAGERNKSRMLHVLLWGLLWAGVIVVAVVAGLYLVVKVVNGPPVT